MELDRRAAVTGSWLELPADDPFDVQTLPYGCIAAPTAARATRPAVRIGGFALPLDEACAQLWPAGGTYFAQENLQVFLAAGPAVWAQARDRITQWLVDPRHRQVIEPLLRPLHAVPTVLPFEVADYVDFYASEHHATRAGRIFRPHGEPLPPNWKHLPVGYHARSASVVVSGTDVTRPVGQWRGPESVEFGPSRRLDFEAEVGFVVGVGSPAGARVPVTAFADHVFGVLLLNDWSARDIQAWESQPLGPFLGKSFATSVSAWITPLAALEHARVPAVARDPQPLPYLDDGAGSWNLDLTLTVELNGVPIATLPFAAMYWTGAQLLAHLTVNGAPVRTGDLYGSGTVSGPADDQCGCLLERTAGGSRPLEVEGLLRTWLLDDDVVSISARGPGPGGRPVGLGEVTGRIRAAR